MSSDFAGIHSSSMLSLDHRMHQRLKSAWFLLRLFNVKTTHSRNSQQTLSSEIGWVFSRFSRAITDLYPYFWYPEFLGHSRKNASTLAYLWVARTLLKNFWVCVIIA